MPPHSPNHPIHDLFPFSPSTPTSTSSSSSSNAARQDKDRPVPPGAMVRYLWTCHACGCGTFRCNDSSVAVCIQCAHQVCDGCTTFFGARLLRCIEVEHLFPHHAANPGCVCEQYFKMSRCRTGHPIRRCPANSGLRRLRHTPYAHPTLVQHCVVTFRPGRDGSPALGTFFTLRPRFDRPRTASRAKPTSSSSSSSSTPTTTTLDCIARSVAAARPTATIPPIYDMLRQPRPGDLALARPGIPVSTVALARFFATGAASVARTLGLSGRPVVCVRVDPMLAFVAYYLCASFYAVFAEWRMKKKSVRQPPRAAP
ncbi:hypothetical protein MY11210_008722, partial [Beauveria gryllotalpidicola]